MINNISAAITNVCFLLWLVHHPDYLMSFNVNGSIKKYMHFIIITCEFWFMKAVPPVRKIIMEKSRLRTNCHREPIAGIVTYKPWRFDTVNTQPCYNIPWCHFSTKWIKISSDIFYSFLSDHILLSIPHIYNYYIWISLWVHYFFLLFLFDTLK